MRIGILGIATVTTIIFSSLLSSQAIAQNKSAIQSDVPASLPATQKIEGRYSGPWVTTGRKKLDGTTNCEIKQLAVDKWQGRFWGEWQKVPFDYTVDFERVKNPPEGLETAQAKTTKNVDLKKDLSGIPVAGKAMIDGASYEWIGVLTREQFNIEYTGSRYEGHLELSRVPEKKTAT
jgi:hypothetical protein